MNDLTRLPTFTKAGDLLVVVESPRGSGLKLKYDPKLGVFLFHRPLALGLSYPYDWGFVPSTKAEDGDPLDAMVVADVPSHPGVVIESRPIAVLELTQKSKRGGRERNDRILAVPAKLERSHGELTPRQRKEIECFFLNAVMFADKAAKILGWKGAGAARKLIAQSRKS